MLDPQETLALCRRLLGLSLLVSGAEHLRIARLLPTRFPLAETFGKSGETGLLRVLLTAYSPASWTGLLGIQVSLSVWMMFTGSGLVLLPLLFIAWLGCVRFHGTFNGGSDMMTFVVGLPLLLQALLPTHTTVAQLAIAAIGTQLVLSYLLAGVAKLGEPDWCRGTAISALVIQEHYLVPAWFQRMVARPGVSRSLSYAVIGFECAAPFALLDPRLSYGYLGLAFGFHASIAATLGLNRFLWAWLAAFPCLPGLGTLLKAGGS